MTPFSGMMPASPFVAPMRRGFGDKVIVSMMENAVQAKVKVEYNESGLCWTLSSPVQSTLEAA